MKLVRTIRVLYSTVILIFTLSLLFLFLYKDINLVGIGVMEISIVVLVLFAEYVISRLKDLSADILKKNIYFSYSAKIVRHDLNSPINIYLPRGIDSLSRKLSEHQIEELRIKSSIKLLEGGLSQAKEVYDAIYHLTDLGREEKTLEKKEVDLKPFLNKLLKNTEYKSMVVIEDLGKVFCNPPLLWISISNFVRNGLKYNDSPNKLVRIYRESNKIIISDNGRGLSKSDFKKYSVGYLRGQNLEPGMGLGLNISIPIIHEHGWKIYPESKKVGTNLVIEVK